MSYAETRDLSRTRCAALLAVLCRSTAAIWQLSRPKPRILVKKAPPEQPNVSALTVLLIFKAAATHYSEYLTLINGAIKKLIVVVPVRPSHSAASTGSKRGRAPDDDLSTSTPPRKKASTAQRPRPLPRLQGASLPNSWLRRRNPPKNRTSTTAGSSPWL
ncbi:hypothetical protein B0H11DRAFT_2421780 [Mycena galericulata]|nr:hypothetical protein B0H11DRAFT_2421780 [Mycena galericulata]